MHLGPEARAQESSIALCQGDQLTEKLLALQPENMEHSPSSSAWLHRMNLRHIYLWRGQEF
jgi:hypothetical protein